RKFRYRGCTYHLHMCQYLTFAPESTGIGKETSREAMRKMVKDNLGRRPEFSVQKPSLVSHSKFNGFLDLFLCFQTKAFRFYQTVFIAGIIELAYRFDLKMMPDNLNFFWPQSFNMEHFQYSCRRLE